MDITPLLFTKLHLYYHEATSTTIQASSLSAGRPLETEIVLRPWSRAQAATTTDRRPCFLRVGVMTTSTSWPRAVRPELPRISRDTFGCLIPSTFPASTWVSCRKNPPLVPRDRGGFMIQGGRAPLKQSAVTVGIAQGLRDHIGVAFIVGHPQLHDGVGVGEQVFPQSGIHLDQCRAAARNLPTIERPHEGHAIGAHERGMFEEELEPRQSGMCGLGDLALHIEVKHRLGRTGGDLSHTAPGTDT